MTTDSNRARLATLVGYDAWGLLEQAQIARVAWQGARGLAMVPVNYAVADGALWFRVDPDSALAQECADQRIVVEVDQVDPATRSGWSVVLAGVPELVTVEDAPELVVHLQIWGPSDVHDTYVRLAPDEVSGRRLQGS